MTGKSNIEWTEVTWNPIVGCDIVSPGCTNCYAMKMAERIELSGTAAHYVGLTEPSKNGPVWTGHISFAPYKAFVQPLRWGKPRMVFVNSMGDLFHEKIDDTALDLLFAIMAMGFHHTFQILTKRHAHMHAYVSDPRTPERVWKIAREIAPEWPDQFCDWMLANPSLLDSHERRIVAAVEDLNAPTTLAKTILPWPLPNVWLGVSTERQQEADERIPVLLQTPAAVRFISAEPLLGHIDLHALNLASNTPSNALSGVRAVPDQLNGFRNVSANKLDWVIVGGESGSDFRPMEEAWARSIRDHCAAAGVAFFMKQMAGKKPIPADLLVRQFPQDRVAQAA